MSRTFTGPFHPKDADEAKATARMEAEQRLSGPVTTRLTEWDTGEFQVVAFHTISEKEDEPPEPGGVYHRELVAYCSVAQVMGLKVQRRRHGRTLAEDLHSEAMHR